MSYSVVKDKTNNEVLLVHNSIEKYRTYQYKIIGFYQDNNIEAAQKNHKIDRVIHKEEI